MMQHVYVTHLCSSLAKVKKSEKYFTDFDGSIYNNQKYRKLVYILNLNKLCKIVDHKFNNLAVSLILRNESWATKRLLVCYYPKHVHAITKASHL